MDAHPLWLVRAGAFLVALYPFTPDAIRFAESRRIPLPVGWLDPETAEYD